MCLYLDVAPVIEDNYVHQMIFNLQLTLKISVYTGKFKIIIIIR